MPRFEISRVRYYDKFVTLAFKNVILAMIPTQKGNDLDSMVIFYKCASNTRNFFSKEKWDICNHHYIV